MLKKNRDHHGTRAYLPADQIKLVRVKTARAQGKLRAVYRDKTTGLDTNTDKSLEKNTY